MIVAAVVVPGVAKRWDDGMCLLRELLCEFAWLLLIRSSESGSCVCQTFGLALGVL